MSSQSAIGRNVASTPGAVAYVSPILELNTIKLSDHYTELLTAVMSLVRNLISLISILFNTPFMIPLVKSFGDDI